MKEKIYIVKMYGLGNLRKAPGYQIRNNRYMIAKRKKLEVSKS